MIAFVLVMLAWPILSVSGTALAVGLTKISEGAAMGLLAASNAMATLVGTFLAGPLVAALGYGVVAPFAIGGLLFAAMLVRREKPIIALNPAPSPNHARADPGRSEHR